MGFLFPSTTSILEYVFETFASSNNCVAFSPPAKLIFESTFLKSFVFLDSSLNFSIIKSLLFSTLLTAVSKKFSYSSLSFSGTFFIISSFFSFI